MTNLSVNKGDNIDFFVIATIVTKNSEIIGLTSLESPFVWNNITYNPGIDFKSFANSTLNLSDSEIYPLTILNNNNLNNFFGSTIEIGFGNQNNLTSIYSFFLGNILSTIFTPQNITLNLVPISYNLKSGIGEYFSSNCRAEFGDKKCKTNISNFTFSGKITSVNNRLLTGDHKMQTIGYFVNGVITFLNGASFRILDDSNGILIATIPDFSINIGDKYNVTAGCNKTLSMCLQNFNNIINFRGEPFINK